MFRKLKLILTRSNNEDKANFFTYESIRDTTNKTYCITNCTDGFLGLALRSGYQTKIMDNDVTITGNIPTAAVVVEMSNLTDELLRLKKH